MKKITCSLIGCGRIALKHEHVLSFDLKNKYKIISVCDTDQSRAKKVGLKLSVPYFNNFFDLLQFQKPDLAIILTESGNHAKHVIQLSKFVKNIVVEKPLALNMFQANKMINTCKLNKVKLFLVKQNRLNPPIQHLKQAILEKRFNKIFLITTRVRWSRTQEYYNQDKWRGTIKLDGSVIANQASHHIDLILWLNGMVKSVFAYSKKSLAKIEADDTVVAILKFKNGSLGCIEATTAARPNDLEGSISVLGEKGSVEISGFAVNKIKTWEFTNKKNKDTKIKKYSDENPPNVYGFGHKKFYANIYNTLVKNKPNDFDGKEGLKSVMLLEAINKSIKLKKEILL